MARSKTYRFVYADRCNMCGSGIEEQAFLGQRLDRSQGLWPKRKPGITTSIFQCKVCGLIYSNPMPLPAELGQHYDVAPEEYWDDSYFQVTPDYCAGPIKRYVQLSKRAPQDCVALDIGAGIGKAMVALGRAGFEVHGIEPSPSFREAAIARMGISPGQLVLSSVEGADFPADSFDFINFGAVLEHIADPAEMLRKSVQWLKPDGLMYVDVPSSGFLLARLMRLFYRMTGARYVINTCPMHVPYHLYEFALQSFVRHGRAAGYSVAFHEYAPGAETMPAWLTRIMRPFNALMRWTSTGMQLAVWLKKESNSIPSMAGERRA